MSDTANWTDRYANRIGTGAHLTDEEVANKVRMLMRDDMDHEMVCVCARDRIALLSRRTRALMTALRAMVDAHVTKTTAPIGEVLRTLREAGEPDSPDLQKPLRSTTEAERDIYLQALNKIARQCTDEDTVRFIDRAIENAKGLRECNKS